jgi:hypothetical protein
MNMHLSEEQFEACVLGQAGRAELDHIDKCAQCRAEFERFGKVVSLFRTAVRDLVDNRIELRTSDASTLMPAAAGIPKWRWALALAAFLAAIVTPLFIADRASNTAVSGKPSPEAVMERLNRHLARTLPAPMEPAMSLIPSEQFTSKPGGVQ